MKTFDGDRKMGDYIEIYMPKYIEKNFFTKENLRKFLGREVLSGER